MSDQPQQQAQQKPEDTGKHYRFEYQGIKLDPFRIAQIYDMKSFALMTVLKKILCAGNRGHKNYKADILDCINALQRELEIIEEDKNAASKSARVWCVECSAKDEVI